jgi:hypothetical protein
MSTTESDNEVIAKFMGFTFFQTEHDRFWNPPHKGPARLEDWMYHTYQLDDFETSWDWLMPVAAKFSALNHEMEEIHSEHCTLISEKILEYDITGAHERLVHGIHWYNSLPSTTKEDKE